MPKTIGIVVVGAAGSASADGVLPGRGDHRYPAVHQIGCQFRQLSDVIVPDEAKFDR